MTGENFSLFLRPWVAEAPNNFANPKIDFTRFNVAYWQKSQRMLRYRRGSDVIISAILEISTHKAQPAAGNEAERRYVRYAVARLSAFSNITWDLGDDLDSFRDEKWTHETGTLLVGWDAYEQLATSHPTHREPQDRGSDWFGFTSIQDWSRRQHALMLEERQIQLKTGRIIPQANEEYAGESARRGVNIWPDTRGGWINGRGDDTMITRYEHMVGFFTSFEWWKTERTMNWSTMALIVWPGPERFTPCICQRKEPSPSNSNLAPTKRPGSAPSPEKKFRSHRSTDQSGLPRNPPAGWIGQF